MTLEGDVEWNFQREAALDAVRNLACITDLYNRITLKAQLSPGDIKNKIEAAFKRNAEIDARRSYDGKVTLRGNVRSWAERDQAQQAALAAPGIMDVENHIAVSP